MEVLFAILILLACFVIGYLLGSISNGIRISEKVAHADVRDYGSHNSGGTNVARVYGKKAGVTTILLDMLKTIIAIYICYFGVKYIPGLHDIISEDYAYLLGGIGSVVGHCWPLYHQFRGGKAVATFAGMIIGTSWVLMCIGVPFFFITLRIQKRVSLSSILTAICMTALSFLLMLCPSWFMNFQMSNYGETLVYLPKILYSLTLGICGSILIYRHKANIQRIKAGTESKVHLFNKKEQK